MPLQSPQSSPQGNKITSRRRGRRSLTTPTPLPLFPRPRREVVAAACVRPRPRKANSLSRGERPTRSIGAGEGSLIGGGQCPLRGQPPTCLRLCRRLISSPLGILSPPPSYLFFIHLLGHAKHTRNIEAVRPLFSSSYWDSRDKTEKR